MNEIIKPQDGALTPWEQAAAENTGNYIQGDSIKFRDGRFYIGKDGRPAPDNMRLAVTDLKAYWVRWEAKRPVQHVQQLGARPPTREELGYTDESQWEVGNDSKPIDPYQNVRYLYLIDPKTAAIYTFITPTKGGRSAISTLGEQIAKAQRAHPAVLPIVELGWAEEPTPYGRKPMFKVVEWRRGEGPEADPPQPPSLERPRGTMTIESGRASSSSPTPTADPNDDFDIPF